MVERIKSLCSERGTSIKALERELGLGNGTIRRWDTNKPSAEKIKKVADYFEVPVSYILGDTDNPSDRSLTHWVESVSPSFSPDIRAAFFEGADDLTEKELDELWEDARDYIQFKIKQKKEKK